MDYEHIKQLAEKRAAASEYVLALGMMNAGNTLEERIARDAQYRLAQDALAKAESEYRNAMDKLSADDLTELVREHNQKSL